MSAPLRLQTHVWNPLGKRRALLLHGAGSDGTCWWRLASELADAGWLVVAPDLRSHGRSPTGDDHGFEVLAADVALLGQTYDLVVAHSLGGAIATHLLTDPGFSRASVLIDPVLRLRQEERERLRLGLRADLGELDVEQLRAGRPGWDERDIHRKVLAARMVTPDVIDGLFESNDPWDVTDRVGEFTGRVHLLAADPAQGGLLDADLLGELVDGDCITGEIVAGAGHAIYRDRPEAVSAAVTSLAG